MSSNNAVVVQKSASNTETTTATTTNFQKEKARGDNEDETHGELLENCISVQLSKTQRFKNEGKNFT